jgi:hypothetical protein
MPVTASETNTMLKYIYYSQILDGNEIELQNLHVESQTLVFKMRIYQKPHGIIMNRITGNTVENIVI